MAQVVTRGLNPNQSISVLRIKSPDDKVARTLTDVWKSELANQAVVIDRTTTDDLIAERALQQRLSARDHTEAKESLFGATLIFRGEVTDTRDADQVRLHTELIYVESGAIFSSTSHVIDMDWIKPPQVAVSKTPTDFTWVWWTVGGTLGAGAIAGLIAALVVTTRTESIERFGQVR